MSGKTYLLSYDLLDRLMRVTDEQGNSYTYTYDANNNMIQMNHTCGTSSADTSYTYDKDSREVTTKCATSYTRTTSYDKFGRPSKMSWNTPTVFDTMLTYFDADTTNRHNLIKTIKNGSDTLEYTYDANANLTSIKNGAGESSFQYDELNQLTRENNHVLGKTITYAYDLGGNLVTVKEYAYTTAEALPGTADRTESGVYDTVWRDKLLNWNGMAMTYDVIGNMLTKGSTSYTWTQGRKLSGVNNGKNIQYYYDHNGARTKKIVDGVATEYRMAGDLLVSEKTDTQTYWYRYDSGANLVSVTIKGKIYFYVKNAQNDVIALVDADGNVVVNYSYDSWGKLLSITGSLADTVGVQNPFRYRGYYYDNETGMYYLRNRYYEPELRRFICSDEIVTLEASLDSLHNRNLYSYCNNNPLVRIDRTGGIWALAVSAIAAGIGALGGALISVGTQMVIEKKSLKEVDISEVVTSAISGAVATTSLGVKGQIVVNAALGGFSSIAHGDSPSEIVYNTFIGGVSGLIGGKGAGFGKKYGNHIASMEGIRNASKPSDFRTIKLAFERGTYVSETKSGIYKTTKGYVNSYTTGNIYSSGKPSVSLKTIVPVGPKLFTYVRVYRNGGWVNVAI